MNDIIIYGMGNRAHFCVNFLKRYSKDTNIVGIVDSSSKSGNMFCNVPTLEIDEIDSGQDVVIAIDSIKIYELIRQKLLERGTSKDKIHYYMDYVCEIRTKRVIEKYEDSTDPLIRETVSWLKEGNLLTVRNQFANNKKIKYKVLLDETINMPYVEYFGRKMYYPKDFPFEVDEEGNACIINVVEEDQYEGSPHQYENSKHCFRGGILVDAGVAEGNFALKYVDIAEKIYLIEPEERWLEALKWTFKPYMDKVIIVPKFLGRKDNDLETTIDSIIGNGRCDFIKMDIEGAEPDALIGAMQVLKNNDVSLSICSYHGHHDEMQIRMMLEMLGYTTACSKGYMFFLYDDDIDLTLDFRHGVVYGERK